MGDMSRYSEADYPINQARLIRDRRERSIAMMAEYGLDALLLGRPSNVSFVSGSIRPWSAGSRAFVPSCVVAASGDLYLMTASDHGIPDEIARDHLYSTTWNPPALIASLAAISGLDDCRTVGIDAMTPLYASLLHEAFPKMTFANAEQPLRRVRMLKTPDELAHLARAVSMTESSLSVVRDNLRPGTTGGRLRGLFSHRMTSFGVTVPALECTISVAEARDGRQRGLLPPDAALHHGDLVTAAGSVTHAGYEGPVSRTWPCLSSGLPPGEEYRQVSAAWENAWQAVSGQLKPGASGGDLRRAWADYRSIFPVELTAHAIGVGYEAPFCGTGPGIGFDSPEPLEPTMTLTVELSVTYGSARYVRSEVVVITHDGFDQLSGRDGAL